MIIHKKAKSKDAAYCGEPCGLNRSLQWHRVDCPKCLAKKKQYDKLAVEITMLRARLAKGRATSNGSVVRELKQLVVKRQKELDLLNNAKRLQAIF